MNKLLPTALLSTLILAGFLAWLLPLSPSRAQDSSGPLEWEEVKISLEGIEPRPGVSTGQMQRLAERMRLFRAKIPGGWLVMGPNGGVTHVPDPKHEWRGGSLPE